jgi:TatD DNase family protein
VGTNEASSVRAVELASQHEHLYAIVGLHPIQTVPDNHGEEGTAEVFNPDFYRNLASQQKVVGIGECGFDYFHTKSDSFGVQEEAFIAQIMLANELQLPLMIHTRGPKPGEKSPTGRSVYEDVYQTLKQYAKVPFNVHFYAGTIPEAEKFFELGGTISFTGVITFAKDYEDIVRHAPLELIHAETDAPYVAPVPHRGRRCEPWMVQEVYKKIATIKQLDAEEVRAQLLKNARQFYSL